MKRKMTPLLVAPLLLVVISCEQKEGERCQQNNDCGSGLICCFGVGGVPGSDGTCKRESECMVADATTEGREETIGDSTAEHEEGEEVEEETEQEARETEDFFVAEVPSDSGDDRGEF